MSVNETESDQGGAGRREVAWRVFAAEYDDADFDYSESDEERAPNYVVTPTGARVNRLFVVGVLTEVEQVSDEVLRGRVVDPTGAFVLYAGQYQPDEMAFLEHADPPMFVAVTGKARTFQPDDSDRVFTSIRPESINEVEAETRDRWVVQTAEQTLSRVSTFADALDSGERGEDLRKALEAGGVDAGLAAGVPLAIDHYGTTKGYLAAVWDLALDSTRVVAGEITADEVGPLDLAPGEGGDEVDVALDYSVSKAEATVEDVEAEPTSEAVAAEPTGEAETATDPETTTEAEDSPATDELGDAPTSSVADAETGTSEDSAEVEAEPESEAEAEDTIAESEVEAEDTIAESEAEAQDTESAEVEDADDAAELQDDIGTDEPPTLESEQDTATDESFAPETDEEDDQPDIGTAGAGDEMYEFDEGEREEVEEEYGLEFSSGAEVDSPEESELEAPDPEQGPDELQDVEPAQGASEEVVNTDDQSPEGGETAAAEAPGASIGETEATDTEVEEAEDSEDREGKVPDDSEDEVPADLENTVIETMDEMNEGDGVERETLLAAVVQQYDVTPADVDDALESALMAGRCYEAGEDTLKPI